MTTAATLVPHDSFIAWPNGGGETPCSAAYAQASMDFDEAQLNASRAEEDEDWEAYGRHSAAAESLRERLAEMREQGHIGKPESYAQPSPGMALLGGATVTVDGRVFNGEQFVGKL